MLLFKQNNAKVRGVYNMKIGRSVYVCSSHRNSVHAAMNMSSLISLILGKCKGAHKIRVRIVLNSVTSGKHISTAIYPRYSRKND